MERGCVTDVHCVFTNSDKTEGRGHEVLACIFADHEEAQSFSEGRGPSGSNAHVRTYPLLLSANEALQEDRDEVRKKALAKLTMEEKVVLGLGGND